MKEIKEVYEPIAASLRQDLQAYLANRKYIRIHYFTEIHEYISDTAIIKDIFKQDEAEYLLLTNGQEVRLDRIVRVDGKPAPGYDIQDSYLRLLENYICISVQDCFYCIKTMKMNTIVVPTDLSEQADQALHFAADLARHTRSKLILYHNMDIPVGLFGNEVYTAADYTFGALPISPTNMEITPELEKIHKEKLQNLAEQLHKEYGPELTIETFFNWGSLNENLNQLVHNEAADLVVMGTKGASGFLDRLIGTNTASYVKEAHVPVLVIPGGTLFRSFKHIAYATGLDQDDTDYLRQLLAFAEPFGASVTLINVKSDQQLDIVPDEQFLADISKRFPNSNINLVRLHQDNVVKGLETFVQQHNLDLLAVAIHEQSFFASLFHSSISEQLTLHSTIPLLALPQKSYKHH